jgi:DNA polymerase I-like protein with 3'-5' exonuclease and polymerase domains
MAQIPSDSLYRQCFVVPEGYKLVGIDASALELRLLAHYMRDDDYIREVLEGDVHTANQNAFKCETRAQAKTIFYAMIYGAGDTKLGEAVGGSSTQGERLRDNFMKNLPAFGALMQRVKKQAANGKLPGLDGRQLWVRSEHSALNTLLQSAGAIVMKKALIIAVEKLERYEYPYKIVAQVHDEIQLEVPEEYATKVGACVRNSIRDSGRHFNLRCPMDGEFKVGDTWADTH